MSTYEVKYGDTIYDIALKTYGYPEYIYKIISDNPVIDSVDFDFDSSPGLSVTWDDTLVVVSPSEVDLKETKNSSDIVSYTATNGQSIYDICLMTYGDLGLLYKLMTENNIFSPNDSNLSGKVFKFNSKLIKDSGFYANIYSLKKVINTLDSTLSGKAYNKSFNISFH